MGPNEQNQHFAELRQKVCLYIHIYKCYKEVCQVWMANLYVLSQKKNGKSGCQTRVRQTIRVYKIMFYEDFADSIQPIHRA